MSNQQTPSTVGQQRPKLQPPSAIAQRHASVLLTGLGFRSITLQEVMDATNKILSELYRTETNEDPYFFQYLHNNNYDLTLKGYKKLASRLADRYTENTDIKKMENEDPEIQNFLKSLVCYKVFKKPEYGWTAKLDAKANARLPCDEVYPSRDST